MKTCLPVARPFQFFPVEASTATVGIMSANRRHL
jgi:hypothetical protein